MRSKRQYVAVVVTNDGQGLVTIDDVSQLNEKSVEGLFRVLRRPGGTSGRVSNPGVAVSLMAEANLQRVIYYTKHFKRIRHTCKHAYVELFKVWSMYHQREMEESHKDPEVVPAVDPRDWPKTLEMVEEYIRGFCRVDGQPLRYGLREDLIAPVAAHDPTYRSNGSEYFTHDEKMIARGSILSGHEVFGTDPEEIGTFADSFISDRAFIRDKMVVIFQVSDAWTYLNLDKKHCGGRL